MSKIYKILIRPNTCHVDNDGKHYTILATVLLQKNGKLIDTSKSIDIVYPLHGKPPPPILGLLSDVFGGLDYEVYITEFDFCELGIWDYSATLVYPTRILNI